MKEMHNFRPIPWGPFTSDCASSIFAKLSIFILYIPHKNIHKSIKSPVCRNSQFSINFLWYPVSLIPKISCLWIPMTLSQTQPYRDPRWNWGQWVVASKLADSDTQIQTVSRLILNFFVSSNKERNTDSTSQKISKWSKIINVVKTYPRNSNVSTSPSDDIKRFCI
jgi:hypothetical protein